MLNSEFSRRVRAVSSNNPPIPSTSSATQFSSSNSNIESRPSTSRLSDYNIDPTFSIPPPSPSKRKAYGDR
jgi:hypothetical protein